jgi:hypothetical protein
MIINKRSNVRKLLYLDVDVFCVGEHLGRYCSTNINLDGAFIESYPCRFCPSDTLDLHFYIEDSYRDSLRLKATVIHTADLGMGVQFDYGYSEYRRLLNAISTYTNDGQALNIPGFWYVGGAKDLTL